MPRNEEGEFELVLGNRQLLSVFFVTVILMGVCFAAGYIFGRNAAGPGGEAAAVKKGAERAIVIDPAAADAKGAAPKSGLAPGQVEVRSSPPAQAPKPAAEKPAPAAERAATPPPRETPKPAAEPPKPVAAAKPAPPAPKPVVRTAGGLIQPASGQLFLQVAAVKRSDADTLVGELKKKDFNAAVGTGPNDALFRVLVGPLGDSGEVTRQRARLKELGFDPILKRY
jgi:cell division septation protein DedD